MIRRARIADADALGALNERTVWDSYGAYVDRRRIAAVAEWMPDRWREGLAREAEHGRETWLLEDGGALVGWVTIGRSRDADALPGDGELWSLYVDPDRIGRGDGRALHEHGLARLRALGHTGVTLWVMEGNARGRAFYARHGWVADDRPGINPWADWGPAIRLRRTLARGGAEE